MSVFADGRILLDGAPATIACLAEALDAGAAEGRVVWYYRENPAGEPPPQAVEALKLVVDRKLPVRLSTTPDFSATPAVAAIEKLLPSAKQRNVATVADTSWAMAEKPEIRQAGQAIPFLGMLTGFGAIGHAPLMRSPRFLVYERASRRSRNL